MQEGVYHILVWTSTILSQNVRQGPHLNPENEKPRNTKRTSLEIISDILKFCGEPRSPTKIMYATNLSYKALKTYMAKLCSLGLLGQNSRKYVTAEKGSQFVLSLENLENMLESSDSTLSDDNARKNRKWILRLITAALTAWMTNCVCAMWKSFYRREGKRCCFRFSFSCRPTRSDSWLPWLRYSPIFTQPQCWFARWISRFTCWLGAWCFWRCLGTEVQEISDTLTLKRDDCNRAWNNSKSFMAH